MRFRFTTSRTRLREHCPDAININPCEGSLSSYEIDRGLTAMSCCQSAAPQRRPRPFIPIPFIVPRS